MRWPLGYVNDLLTHSLTSLVHHSRQENDRMHHEMERMSRDMRSSAAAAAAAVSSRLDDPYADPLTGGVGGRSRGLDDGRGGRMGGLGDHMGVGVGVDRDVGTGRDSSRRHTQEARLDRSKSPVPDFNVRSAVEIAELQDKLEKTNNELRRAQAELRLNQSDYDRSHVELEQLHEKVRARACAVLERPSSMQRLSSF